MKDQVLPCSPPKLQPNEEKGKQFSSGAVRGGITIAIVNEVEHRKFIPRSFYLQQTLIDYHCTFRTVVDSQDINTKEGRWHICSQGHDILVRKTTKHKIKEWICGNNDKLYRWKSSRKGQIQGTSSQGRAVSRQAEDLCEWKLTVFPKAKVRFRSPYKLNKQNVLNWDSVFSLIIPSSHHTFPLWNPQHIKHRGSQRMWLPSQPLLVWIFPLGQPFPVCDMTGIRARFSLNVKTLRGHYKISLCLNQLIGSVLDML